MPETNEIITIEDLLRIAYGDPYGYLTGQYGTGAYKKAEDPVLTTTTNALVNLYGPKAFRNLNDQINFSGVIPKAPFRKTGSRVISADGGASADGALSEGATLPDSIKPALQKYKSVPKEVAHKFRVSTKQEYLYTKAEDDAALGMEDSRVHTEIKHRKAINQQLLRYAGTGATGDRFESLDKIISANNEIALVGANNADIYDIDRDAGAGFSDAYVNHNSGTDRFITDTLVLALVENMDEAGANISFFLTGNDIASDLASVYNTQIRYNNLGETKIQVGVNGIQTDKGLAAGSRVATLYDIPIIKDKNVAKDTASKFYAIDTTIDERVGEARLYMKVAIPTMYFETGPNVNGRIFEANALVNQGIYLTSGELWCNDFSKQGKLIDLK